GARPRSSYLRPPGRRAVRDRLRRDKARGLLPPAEDRTGGADRPRRRGTTRGPHRLSRAVGGAAEPTGVRRRDARGGEAGSTEDGDGGHPRRRRVRLSRRHACGPPLSVLRGQGRRVGGVPRRGATAGPGGAVGRSHPGGPAGRVVPGPPPRDRRRRPGIVTLRPHNDWSGIVPDPAAAEALTAAVVIPVYNRPDLLARTLAGLERSTRKVPVIVADDGSTADIASVVEASPLDVTLVRQEHDGNGAARARNLGAAHAGDVDVLIFVDADCIPHPDLVANHLAWHTASESVVTIGRRVHVRVADIPIESIASGEADLETRIQTGFSGRPDFRTVLQRRTAHSTAGDEAFRTFVSSNVAVPRFLFEATGGFADRFPHWGAEDTELGWRLWQEGAFFVPFENALVYHQLDEDEEGGYEGRKTARLLNDGALATLVPHGFYRKPRRDVIYEVPKVSIVVHQPPTTLDDLWSDVASQTAPDFELILAGCDERHEPMAGLLEGDPRVSLVPSLAEGIAAARGELVVTVHGSAALDHRFLARVVKHFHDRPTASSLTVGYTIPSDPPQTYLSADDATFVDSGWEGELPIVTIARRRDWVKARSLEPTQAWAEIRR